jgi:hypothetical protein
MLVPTAEPLRPNNANAMHHNDDDDNEDDDSGWVASMLHQSDADRINRGLAPANSLKAVGVVASCCAPTSFHRCNILSYTLLIHTLIHTLSYTFSHSSLSRRSLLVVNHGPRSGCVIGTTHSSRLDTRHSVVVDRQSVCFGVVRTHVIVRACQSGCRCRVVAADPRSGTTDGIGGGVWLCAIVVGWNRSQRPR